MADLDTAVRTATGRKVAYTQTGQADGAPVFYCHGFPGSRLDFHQPFNQPALDGSGVRLIGLDRPGFGESEFQPRRRYSDWPSDVSAVADELGIERFGIIAYSAGGPYAIACALAYPERLTFVGIVSGVGPAETPGFHRGMGATNAILTRLSRWARPLARLAISRARKQVGAAPEKFSRQFDKELSPPDVALHRDAGLRQAARNLFLESTKNGPRGAVEDYRVWANPSGLDLTSVSVPVRIWHGNADEIVPMHHAEYVAEKIPTADLTVLPGVGHLHTAERWREFLTAATNQAR
jgi:pimeloyl-ACP methyl ester carboxylesterase